jgi:Leucine-rich repeat (LRR) protein
VLTIDLSFNRLEKIKRGAFGRLPSLRSIQLHHNRLKEIPTPSISMNQLYLANNNITEIKGRSPWPVMNSLLLLDLDNNNLGDSLDGGKKILGHLGSLKVKRESKNCWDVVKKSN